MAEGELTKGSVFAGRYEVVRRIKRGGMGAVYEVVDKTTQRRRALKVMLAGMLSDGDLQRRFQLEATVTANVDSEHIVETFDAGIGPNAEPFMVMELLKGEDLEELLDRDKRLDAKTTLSLLRQLASALDKTHTQGIIHRDLKPANLFITERENGEKRLKVLDFGVAKVLAAESGKTTRTVGTPLYMAPEQFKPKSGALDHRIDLFALSQIAFEMLVGRPYWFEEGERSDGIYGLVLTLTEGPKESASVRAKRLGVELPPSFDAWFARAAARVPEERFVTAKKAVDALEAALADFEVKVLRDPPPAGAKRASQHDAATVGGDETRPSFMPDLAERDGAPNRDDDSMPPTERASEIAPEPESKPRRAISLASDAPSPSAVATKKELVPRPVFFSGLAILVALGFVLVRSILASSDAPGNALASASPPVARSSETAAASASTPTITVTPASSAQASAPAASATVEPASSSLPAASASAATSSDKPHPRAPTPGGRKVGGMGIDTSY